MPVSYTLLMQPRFRSLLDDGTPNVGGKVYTYAAGTTTPATTYSDPGLATPNTNPIILDAQGQADIWYSGPYKLICQDASGVQLWSADQLFGFKSDVFCSLPVQDEDKYLVWDGVDKKFKNSTMTMTDVEQIVTAWNTAMLTNSGVIAVSPTDTTPGMLSQKIVGTPGTVVTIINQGGNERLQISAAPATGPALFLNANFITA